MPPLPPLPRVAVEVVGERAEGARSFLRVRHAMLRVRRGADAPSEPFGYDLVERTALDAVVVAAHFRGADGRPWVYLLSAVRPPAALRPPDARPMPEKPTLGSLWEVPAGLVEPDERSAEGLRRCAARELGEEIGVRAAPGDVVPLGPPTFPSPGVIGERHFFFRVEVDPAARADPPGDGSVLERGATVAAVPLDEALRLARTGEIEDAKTEIALRRLAEALA